MKGAGLGQQRVGASARKSKSNLKLEGPGLSEASQASIDASFSEN